MPPPNGRISDQQLREIVSELRTDMRTIKRVVIGDEGTVGLITDVKSIKDKQHKLSANVSRILWLFAAAASSGGAGYVFSQLSHGPKP